MLFTEETKNQIHDILKIENFKDFLHGFAVVWQLLQKVVAVVEYMWSELGDIEKDDRIEYAAEALDQMIQFPFWLEPFDKKLFKVAISAAVQALNERFKTSESTDRSPTTMDLTAMGTDLGLPINLVN